jgi:hypothetical protein
MNSPSAASGSNTIMAAKACSIASMVIQRVITANSALGICADRGCMIWRNGVDADQKIVSQCDVALI